MRRGLSLQFLGVLMAAAALVGCRNQTGGITNPFITADKVPPPSTRVLAPGTAQPYYPGDPVPGAVPAGTPVIGAPVATPGFVPSTTMPGYAPAGAAPAMTTPPGGWGGTYAPQSSVTPTGPSPGETVSVPTDPQGMRFAGGAEQAAPGAADGGTSMANLSAPAPNMAGMRLPIQSILPVNGADPALLAPLPTQLTQRDVTAAEYFAAPTSLSAVQPASATLGGDGFRPQGSTSRPSTSSAPTNDAFRPPSMHGSSDANGHATTEDATRFAAGENYESLRGQLEYWPVSGEWSLRYQAEGAAADALGGRVMIDNPQVLANLQPGEMVMVRGQAYSRSTESGAVQPAYRVSAVQRQRL
jgi:hypothetical protein